MQSKLDAAVMVNALDQPTCSVAEAEAGEIFEMYGSDPCIAMCRSIILENLLSGGIAIEHLGETATPEFHAHLQKFWVPLYHEGTFRLFCYSRICSLVGRDKR